MLGTTQYIPLETARKMMTTAQAEAQRNGWNVAIAIVDAGTHLILFQKMDQTQVGSVEIAIGKARTAVKFKRPTKLMEDMIAKGRHGFLAMDQIIPVQGGVPVIVDGACLGAVGVSGVSSEQDEQVAMAAIGALEI